MQGGGEQEDSGGEGGGTKGLKKKIESWFLQGEKGGDIIEELKCGSGKNAPGRRGGEGLGERGERELCHQLTSAHTPHLVQTAPEH